MSFLLEHTWIAVGATLNSKSDLLSLLHEEAASKSAPSLARKSTTLALLFRAAKYNGVKSYSQIACKGDGGLICGNCELRKSDGKTETANKTE